MKREQENNISLSAEVKLKNIFENASECIIFLDKSGRIADVNRKTLEVFGGSKDEVLGKHFTELDVVSITDLPKVMKHFTKMVS